MTTSKSKGREFIALDQLKQKQHLNKIKKIKKKDVAEVELNEDKPGVIYLSHIPHGFFEPQMKSYFEQFGDVNKLRLSRSKKSGRSKGYAFIEFASSEVAKVVAETMNNYLMYEKSLKCKVMTKDQIHPLLFKGHDEKFKPNSRKRAMFRYNRRSEDLEKVKKRSKKAKQRQNKTKKALEELGIEFDFTKVSTKPDWKPPPRNIAKVEPKVKRRKVVQPDIWEPDQPEQPLDVTAEMLVDDADQEINFKTPPKMSKIQKKSLDEDKSEKEEPAELNEEKTESEEKKADLEKVKEVESKSNSEKEEIVEKADFEETAEFEEETGIEDNLKPRKVKQLTRRKGIKTPKSCKKTSLSRKRKLLNLTM